VSNDRRNPWQRPLREVLIDRQIREAMDEGKFDNLPYQGERLPLEDDSAAGDWALAFRMLRNAGAAPAWIEADKEARRLLARRDRIVAQAGRTVGREWRRRELVRIVGDANAAIATLNADAPTDRQHRQALDLAAELARLQRAEAARQD
jgi:hypothetical protein